MSSYNDYRTKKQLKTIIDPTSSVNKKNTATKTVQSLEDINIVVQKSASDENKPWNKLDKTTKLKHLKEFSVKYSQDNELTEDAYNALNQFFIDSLNRKRFQRAKDVQFNIDEQCIESIPCLVYNRNMNMFTLKLAEKQNTTAKLTTGTSKKNSTQRNLSHDD